MLVRKFIEIFPIRRIFLNLDYRGVLACLDGYMNIALEQTEEYSGGQLKNKYGDAFIRGNNVLYISTQRKKWNSDDCINKKKAKLSSVC